ncbi:MAG TPA: TIGR03936 family radical SAM-associated protein [Planctomycetota bacterium]|nr:TIGR03936 family radical SAM-associated protein [Planctomycetota bacterium]
MTKQKVRLRFTKKGEVKFLSHHDLMRFFERAIRRAALPVKMSQGFNPRPKFSIAAALGVGVSAEQEILEIELEEQLAPDFVLRKLSQTLINGIAITSAEYTGGKPARISGASYEVQLPLEFVLAEDAAQTLLARELVEVERIAKNKKTRRVNIRPYIRNIHAEGSTVRMELAITDSGAARPEEVIAALAAGQEIDRNRLRIVRTTLEVEPQEQS